MSARNRASYSVRQKEAEDKAAKRRAETQEHRERRKLQDSQAKAAKRQSVAGRRKEAEAKAAKRQAETEKEREHRRLQDSHAKAAKRQSETMNEKLERRLKDVQSRKR